jgi:3-methyladenine DNA glycosylase/8-oxoguanine DNA glycosylase
MSVLDRVLDGLMRVIRMNDKVEALSRAVVQQQARIEDLTARIIRLETALELAIGGRREGTGSRKRNLLPPED